MTRDSPYFPFELDKLNKMQLEQLKASYAVVVDHDILFAATLLVSVSNLANLNSEQPSASGKKGPARSCTLASKTLDLKDEEDLVTKPCKKRRFNPHTSKVSEFTDRICAYCKCTETPMWRHGPPGFQNLCNKVIYD